MLWEQRYDGPSGSYDSPSDLEVDALGNVYITGFASGFGPGSDYTTIKYDNFGSQLWVSSYNGPGNLNDMARSIKLDLQGNIYITGISYGIGSDFDYGTVKYDNSGNQLWVRRYNGPGNNYDGSRGIVLDNSGNVYITGLSTGNGTLYDIATIKYSQNSSSKPVQTGSPLEFSTKSYPNPFNPSANIEFNLPEKSYVRLIIYDMTGKEIESLINGEMNEGSHNISWNAENYSSGIYFYKLTAVSGNTGFSKTMKLNLIK